VTSGSGWLTILLNPVLNRFERLSGKTVETPAHAKKNGN